MLIDWRVQKLLINVPCSCSSIATKSIWVGSPLITNAKLDGTTSLYSSNPANICPGSHWITVTPIGSGASYANWTVQNGVPYTVTYEGLAERENNEAQLAPLPLLHRLNT